MSTSILPLDLSLRDPRDVEQWTSKQSASREDILQAVNEAVDMNSSKNEQSVEKSSVEIFALGFTEELAKMEKMMLIDDSGSNITSVAKRVRQQGFLAELVSDSIEIVTAYDDIEASIITGQWSPLAQLQSEKEKVKNATSANDEFSFEFNNF